MSDDALFSTDDVPQGQVGATERAVRAACKAAALDERDRGAAELAAQLARAVDVGSRVRRDPYAVAAAGRELAAVLQRLRLDPTARAGNDASDIETFLQSLNEAT